MFCLLQKVRLFRIYLCLYKERHNHPLKGLIAFEVRPPIKLISLLLPDRCFKINQTTFLPQTFRSSKFSVHSLAFSLFRSRLARIRQHSFLPKKMYFFPACLQNIHQNAEHLTGTFNDVWFWKIRTYQYVLVASNIWNIWVFPVVLLLFHQSAHDWWFELF